MNKILIVPSEKDCNIKGYFYIPSYDIFPYENLENSWFVRSKRIYSLYLALNNNLNGVATLYSVTRFVMPPAILKKYVIELKVGDIFESPEELFSKLGYERVYNVTEGGQFSIRGDIIDFYGPNEVPTRIELFDNLIEDIRHFDPSTQKSVRKIEKALILPAREYIEPVIHETMIGDKYNGTFLDYNIEFQIFNKPKVIESFSKKEREIRQLIIDPKLRQNYIRYSGIDFKEIIKIANEIDLKTDIQKLKIDKKKKEKINSLPVLSEDEFNIGDIVVHKEYGIAKFVGTTKITQKDLEREFLILQFNDSKLFVPTDRLDLVQKYIGTNENVALDNLKKNNWSKRVKKAKSQIEKIVKEILRINALRKNTKGISLLGDSELEKEFAKTFPHIETQDQLKAIEEVSEDLSSEKNMDRLLAGDAGYGKTEVAMRAAFKAAISGKQVAVLVPTTVLARQHYENFKKRFEPFGINVELYDSSLTKKQKDEVKQKIETGITDVVIGTHGLLKSIKFSDLGLLIIDEEQKFGVQQKEALKKLRININILSMSATPIPRTLHMALSGIKDMSVIKTPPFGRKNIQVYVNTYDEKIIRQAIMREINRGGQVLYVHNRVNDIEDVAKKLKEIVPEVSIDIANGQMPKKKMEKVIEEFYHGKLDVLVATSIIENGVDIPNANTLIVDDAHRYGLAQLYQLRGRVGRSDKRAFAYFFHPSKINKVAKERLKAIKEIMGPGSGFQIALKDMEIRGIGNILGLEQHGFINDIGFHYYFEILEEVLNKEYGKITNEIKTEIIGIKGSIIIPEEYIANPIERLRIYRRISSFENEQMIFDLIDELNDRFGKVPQSVLNLLKYAKMRIIASKLSINKIELHEDNIVVYTAKKISFSLPNIYNEKEQAYIIYSTEEEFINEIEKLSKS
ncbi:transcription-repair coupling factor (superfamily II helicase) [Thermosipho japonicus]|uniref:Transcription-repair-coupling factor n=1 Tax=Thermosipho japonicus TaxID=90323 RepID=A0A841GVR6_9BACT|nr:DEAD/DEAH box helicase [Thermosipho japonicus]MBB6063201.1 transcription-repair coupling factor (superfamily II helicase) [Thermosipho japonicus]